MPSFSQRTDLPMPLTKVLPMSRTEAATAIGLTGVAMAAASAAGAATNGRSKFFQASLLGFGLHAGTHLAQSALLRRYTPGLITTPLVVIPFTTWAWRRLKTEAVPIAPPDHRLTLALAASRPALPRNRPPSPPTPQIPLSPNPHHPPNHPHPPAPAPRPPAPAPRPPGPAPCPPGPAPRPPAPAPRPPAPAPRPSAPAPRPSATTCAPLVPYSCPAPVLSRDRSPSPPAADLDRIARPSQCAAAGRRHARLRVLRAIVMAWRSADRRSGAAGEPHLPDVRLRRRIPNTHQPGRTGYRSGCPGVVVLRSWRLMSGGSPGLEAVW